LLADEGEDDLYRGDALLAICEIDAREGRSRALPLAARGDFLGSTARRIGEHGCETAGRSYFDALRRHHD